MDNVKQFSALCNDRLDRLAERVPLSAPLAMHIELTNKCNFACTFCPESFPDYANSVGGFNFLTMDKFEKICRDLNELGRVRVLRFHMLGDALLNKEALAMIRHAYDAGVAERIELTTNAAALTRHKIDEMIHSGLDYLRVSVYATEAERHKALTGSSMPPERIADNVRALRARRDALGASKPFIYAKMIDSLDAFEVESFKAIWSKIADECCLEPAGNWNSFAGRNLMENIFKDGVDKRVVPKPQREVCPFPFYTMVIHSDGEVGLCCVDWNKKTSVGNVFTESLSAIWSGNRLRAFQAMQIERRSYENDSCRNCNHRSMSADDLDGLTDASVLERKRS